MQLDLNLLTALDALWTERSVTGAADRLHLTPSAMSRALGRIRIATGDEILVRSGRTMIPTPLVEEIGAEVHQLVERAHAVLSAQRGLNLSTLERTFTVRMNDAILAACAAELLTRLRADAPQVQLRLLAETATDPDELRYGQVDLIAGAGIAATPDMRFNTVSHDTLVLALDAHHPHSGRAMTAEQYADAAHVTVSRRGRLRDPIDELLHARGLHRHVIASVPTATAALHLIRGTDIVVAIAERTQSATAIRLGLRLQPIPLPIPDIPIILGWHRRHDTDQAHRWLRSHLHDILTGHDPRPSPR